MTFREVPFGALCCECGNFRPGVGGGRHTVAWWPNSASEEEARGYVAKGEAELVRRPYSRTTAAHVAYWRQQLEHLYENVTCDLKCPVCGEVTRHAIVRQPDKPDVFEEDNRERDSGRLFQVVEVPNLARGHQWKYVEDGRVLLVRGDLRPDVLRLALQDAQSIALRALAPERQLQVVLDEMATRGVSVRQRPVPTFACVLYQYLDDGVWLFDYDPATPQPRLSQCATQALATIEHPETERWWIAGVPGDTENPPCRSMAWKR